MYPLPNSNTNMYLNSLPADLRLVVQRQKKESLGTFLDTNRQSLLALKYWQKSLWAVLWSLLSKSKILSPRSHSSKISSSFLILSKSINSFCGILEQRETKQKKCLIGGNRKVVCLLLIVFISIHFDKYGHFHKLIRAKWWCFSFSVL